MYISDVLTKHYVKERFIEVFLANYNSSLLENVLNIIEYHENNDKFIDKFIDNIKKYMMETIKSLINRAKFLKQLKMDISFQQMYNENEDIRDIEKHKLVEKKLKNLLIFYWNLSVKT